MLSLVSHFLQRFLPTQQGEQPQNIVYLPLPCPIHACALVPEACGDPGEYRFHCPLCRLACQAVVRETEPLALKPAQDGQEKPSRPGGLLHSMRAKNRFMERLGRQRLVLMNFDANSRPQDTDALKFARDVTVGELPKIRKASLPDVG